MLTTLFSWKSHINWLFQFFWASVHSAIESHDVFRMPTIFRLTKAKFCHWYERTRSNGGRRVTVAVRRDSSRCHTLNGWLCMSYRCHHCWLAALAVQSPLIASGLQSGQFWTMLTAVWDLVPSVLHLSDGFQCSPTLNCQPYEGRLPLTSWWRKSSNMTVWQSSLISLAHHCYDWHPGSRCG